MREIIYAVAVFGVGASVVYFLTTLTAVVIAILTPHAGPMPKGMFRPRFALGVLVVSWAILYLTGEPPAREG